MSFYCVKKSELNGGITIPSSKSHTLRAILFASLATGKSVIHYHLPSPDTSAMIEACRLFGAKILVFKDRLEIEGIGGKITQTENVIDAGNSGIVLRFCAAIGALSSHPVVITGDHSIRHNRPMKPLLDGLLQLNVEAKSMRGDGYAPVIIQGPIQPGTITIDGTDSQNVSALLIASAFAAGPVEIQVLNPGEKPWVDLTLHWLNQMNISYSRDGYERFFMQGNSRYPGFEYHVPGDLSSAAFPIAAALITDSEILLHNVDLEDIQGDKELIFLLQDMGAHFLIDAKNKTLQVKKSGVLKGCKADINNYIDALPILAVIGCFAEGETHILNAKVAKQKECDRITSIGTELQKMGANLVVTEDGLKIKKSELKGTNVHSYHDHRMAMSLAIAGLGSSGETSVSPVDCVAKTFPSFLKDFHAMGANFK
jgi:3-phosphoshikimate 1-carboxyvinyltransferase